MKTQFLGTAIIKKAEVKRIDEERELISVGLPGGALPADMAMDENVEIVNLADASLVSGLWGALDHMIGEWMEASGGEFKNLPAFVTRFFPDDIEEENEEEDT